MNIKIENDGIAVINKDNCTFKIDLRSGEITVIKVDNLNQRAKLCIEAKSEGWNNSGLTQHEVSIISKILAITTNNIPTDLCKQIKYFLKTGYGGPNIFPITNPDETYRTSKRYMHNLRILFNI
ncbi:MAG: hypothetical protein ACTSRP_00580 [Candidatus Helarchaeota archaeon]